MKNRNMLFCLTVIILLPIGFQVEDNGRELQLITYLTFMFQDVSLSRLTDITKYEKEREQQIYSLLTAYKIGRQEMIYWFKSYIEWKTIWETPWIITNSPSSSRVIQPDVGTIFTLPELSRVYYTYMPLRAITSTSSWQYRFAPYLTADEFGFTRFNDAYGIALGTYFGSRIGTIYLIEFANGEQIYGVLADVKSDLHTDPTHRYAPGMSGLENSGNILEFVMEDRVPHLWSIPMPERVNHIGRLIRTRFPYRVISIKKVGYANTGLNN